jgi:hypothetical protein
MDLIITTEQRDALLAYLVRRPFKEVAGAVAWLQQLPPAPPPPKESRDTE